MPLLAHVAFDGFENELVSELGPRLRERHGPILLADAGPEPVWAKNTWLSPEKIEIQSITDAARALRARGPRWHLESFQLHRRARLIQDKLPKVHAKALEFLGSPPEKPTGSWTLMSPHLILASPTCTSPFPGGEFAFVETKSAPSRAYLKLWELFSVRGVRPPKPGETCVDLGASPGGWTWVLAKLGARVTAVDRAPLGPKTAGLAGVTFVKGDAFSYRPPTKVDWMFSDVICFPEDIHGLIKHWIKEDLARNLVCSVKLKGETDHRTIESLLKIPGSRGQHLLHNKHEITWWLER